MTALLLAQDFPPTGGGIARFHGELARHYSTRIRDSFTARFRAYKIAQDWLSSPTVANCLAWRANRSAFVKEQLEGMLQETVDPRQLFSPAGAIRSLVS